MRRWQQEKRLIAELRDDGLTQQKIGKAVGLTQQALGLILKRHKETQAAQTCDDAEPESVEPEPEPEPEAEPEAEEPEAEPERAYKIDVSIRAASGLW